MTKQAAKDKLEGTLPALIARFGDSVSDFEHAWQGNSATFSFRARGFDVQGSLKITDSDVVVDMKLPFVARLFESTIRSNVELELDTTLRAD